MKVVKFLPTPKGCEFESTSRDRMLTMGIALAQELLIENQDPGTDTVHALRVHFS